MIEASFCPLLLTTTTLLVSLYHMVLLHNDDVTCVSISHGSSTQRRRYLCLYITWFFYVLSILHARLACCFVEQPDSVCVCVLSIVSVCVCYAVRRLLYAVYGIVRFCAPGFLFFTRFFPSNKMGVRDTFFHTSKERTAPTISRLGHTPAAGTQILSSSNKF